MAALREIAGFGRGFELFGGGGGGADAAAAAAEALAFCSFFEDPSCELFLFNWGKLMSVSNRE